MHAKITLTALSGLHDRVRNAAKKATLVMESVGAQITSHGYNFRIIHPSLPDHPTHAQAEKFLVPGTGPTVFAIKRSAILRGALMRAVKRTNLEWKTSYGGQMSRIDPFPSLDRATDTTLFRVSIGYWQNEPIDRIVSEIVLLALHVEKEDP